MRALYLSTCLQTDGDTMSWSMKMGVMPGDKIKVVGMSHMDGHTEGIVRQVVPLSAMSIQIDGDAEILNRWLSLADLMLLEAGPMHDDDCGLSVGDVVSVVDGSGASGVIRQMAAGPLLGIEFDNKPGEVYHYYLTSEVVVTMAAPREMETESEAKAANATPKANTSRPTVTSTRKHNGPMLGTKHGGGIVCALTPAGTVVRMSDGSRKVVA